MGPQASTRTLFLPRVENRVPTFLTVEPGYYFVSHIAETGNTNISLRHSFGTHYSVFNAKPGQISFPGTWHIRVRLADSSVVGTLGQGSASATYQIETWTEPTLPKEESIRRLYPRHYPALRLVNTKLQQP